MASLITAQHNLELWVAVQAYHYEGLCRRFSEKHKMPVGAARAVFEEMKRFLYISMITGEPCSPSRIVDEMWHEFILHTADYRAFCDKYNGGFIDHSPSDVPEIVGYVRTKAVAEEIFGELDPTCWPMSAKAAAALGTCTCSNKGCTCNCSETDARAPRPTIADAA